MSIPAVRDRIVQAALKIVLEPVFEADMLPCSFGFRLFRYGISADHFDKISRYARMRLALFIGKATAAARNGTHCVTAPVPGVN